MSIWQRVRANVHNEIIDTMMSRFHMTAEDAILEFNAYRKSNPRAYLATIYRDLVIRPAGEVSLQEIEDDER